MLHYLSAMYMYLDWNLYYKICMCIYVYEIKGQHVKQRLFLITIRYVFRPSMYFVLVERTEQNDNNNAIVQTITYYARTG